MFEELNVAPQVKSLSNSRIEFLESRAKSANEEKGALKALVCRSVQNLPVRHALARTVIGVQGFDVEVVSENPALISWLQSDYPKNRSGHSPSLKILVAQRKASSSRGFFSSPRSQWRCFGTKCQANFFGKVSVEYSFQGGFALIFGEEAASVYEVVEMTISTFLGEKGDGLGRHRVHGLGVSWKNEGVLLLGKSGTGKTTLGAELLANRGVNFYSDDTPWVDRQGRLHAFAHRFSFKTMPSFPSAMVRVWDRPRHGVRYLLHTDLLSGRWASPLPVTKIFFLERTMTRRSQKVGRLRLFCSLLRWLVLGLETPQIFEMRIRVEKDAIRRGLCDFVSRLFTAARLAGTVPAYRLCYQPGEKASDQLLEWLT